MAQTGIDITVAVSPDAKVSARNVAASGDPVFQQHVQQVEAGYDVVGDIEQFVVDATAGGTSLEDVHADAEYALVSVETAPVRWSDHPTTDPSATVGHLLTPPTGDAVYFWLAGRQRLLDFKMFRTTGVSANIQVSYYKARIPDA